MGSVALALAVYAMVEILRFVPVGMLAVLSVSRTLGAAAAAGSLLVTGLLVAYEIGWQWPGALDLALPIMGCALGAGACLGWVSGRLTWRGALVTLVGLLLVPPLVAGITMLAVSEREPFVRASPAPTSEEKRRLYLQLRPKNPRKLPPGETRTLSLESRDLDRLLAWGLPVVLGDGRAAARVDFASPAGGHPGALAPPARRRPLSEPRGRRAGGHRPGPAESRRPAPAPRAPRRFPGRRSAGSARSSPPSSRPSGGRARSWPAWTDSTSSPAGSPWPMAGWSSRRACWPASSGARARTRRCGSP